MEINAKSRIKSAAKPAAPAKSGGANPYMEKTLAIVTKEAAVLRVRDQGFHSKDSSTKLNIKSTGSRITISADTPNVGTLSMVLDVSKVDGVTTLVSADYSYPELSKVSLKVKGGVKMRVPGDKDFYKFPDVVAAQQQFASYSRLCSAREAAISNLIVFLQQVDFTYVG